MYDLVEGHSVAQMDPSGRTKIFIHIFCRYECFARPKNEWPQRCLFYPTPRISSLLFPCHVTRCAGGQYIVEQFIVH